MIGQRIKACRKAAGISQEELATRLGVVRQTVSKWERGLSAPDAETLVRLAEILQVPVGRLLGEESEEARIGTLTDELSRLNDALARQTQRALQLQQAGRKRGQILLLSVLSLIAMLTVQNELASVVVSAVFLLAAGGILCRNLTLLTGVTTDDLRTKTLRRITAFDLCLFVVCVAAAILIGTNTVQLTERGETLFATAILALVMVVGGLVSPHLPFNRHTGLRLPWTVLDEDTWNLAHRLLGVISLPLAILFVAASLTIPYPGIVAIVTMALWIGIPGAASGVFFWRRTRGRRT